MSQQKVTAIIDGHPREVTPAELATLFPDPPDPAANDNDKPPARAAGKKAR